MQIPFQIDTETMVDIGGGVYFIPESKMYVEKMGDVYINMIFGKDLPNPVNITAQGRTPSERVNLLWNDWAKRKRA